MQGHLIDTAIDALHHRHRIHQVPFILRSIPLKLHPHGSIIRDLVFQAGHAITLSIRAHRSALMRRYPNGRHGGISTVTHEGRAFRVAEEPCVALAWHPVHQVTGEDPVRITLMSFHMFINTGLHLTEDLGSPGLLLDLPQYSSFIAGTNEYMWMSGISLCPYVCG